MMVMPANHASGIVHYLAGRYPGKIGMLNSPLSWKNPPEYMPWALDNGCFTDWQPDKFKDCLKRAISLHAPLWVAVPDVVADPEETLIRWHGWHNEINFPLAFVCQDGHESQDVPDKAFCCFIGGTTQWKLKNAHRFKGVRPWLHIGRVNTYQRLRWAEDIGADSVDGTGFFRGDKNQLAGLIEFFERKQEKLGLEFQGRELK